MCIANPQRLKNTFRVHKRIIATSLVLILQSAHWCFRSFLYSQAALLSYFYLSSQILTYPFIIKLLRFKHVPYEVKHFSSSIQRDIRVPDRRSNDKPTKRIKRLYHFRQFIITCFFKINIKEQVIYLRTKHSLNERTPEKFNGKEG